jgi:pyruvate-ferredoxin/flavodoxin oxidoreductase
LPEAGATLPPVADIHRFWEQTGHFYATGRGNDNLLDPFIGASVVPAATGIFRDMTGIRFEHPLWIPEKCTGCGKCITACPDSAMPGLVNSVAEVFATALNRVECGGTPTRHLRRAVRTADKKLRALLGTGSDISVRPLIDQAIDATVAEAAEEDRAKMAAEFELLKAQLGPFDFAACKPYWSVKEKKAPGSGGLLSITVNPLTCKACGLCVNVCGDDALKMVTQTEDSVARLRQDWAFWLDLPTTSRDYIRVDNIDEKSGALETLLLDKAVYQSMNCGDGACLGCGEKTAIHLFTADGGGADAAAGEVIRWEAGRPAQRLEAAPAPRLAASMDLTDTGAVVRAVDANANHDLTLSTLAATLGGSKPCSRWTRPGSSARRS